MNCRTYLLLMMISAPLFYGTTVAVAGEGGRQRISLNRDWRFQKDDPAEAAGVLSYEKIKVGVVAGGMEFLKNPLPLSVTTKDLGAEVSYTQGNYDDGSWRTLTLPHDWGIEGPFKQEYAGETGKLPWWGIGWYRKHLNVPEADKGQRLFLDIDGAMSYSCVWINGHFVGGWPYGYSSYRVELTPYVKFGEENVLAVRLDNPKDSSRWYPGGGIYRNVWLVTTAPVHIAHWGTYITTPEVTPTAATVAIKTMIANQADAEANMIVRTEIFAIDGASAKHGSAVASVEKDGSKIAREANEVDECRITLKDPKLWDLNQPNLYCAVTTLVQDGKEVDRYETTFGIRTIKFDPDKGFLLNGKVVKLQGVCDHHDLGALGSAINTRALERQVDILKEMGCNAIRTSHNPPAPELLDWCDRKGIVVMDESFDCWRAKKKTNDYHLLFDEWHEKDLRALIRRDRNHPCVVLWSVGNEVSELRNGAEGSKIARELVAIAHDEDPTRPTIAACHILQAGYNGIQKELDVFGYNYKPFEYGKFKQKNPEIPLLGSETASCISSRGEYFFPVSENKDLGKADFQMSSYDLYAPSWATPPDAEFKGQDEFPFVGGEFVWTGFDYLGEPTPYNSDASNLLNFTDQKERDKMQKELEELGKIQVPSRSSYFGIVDLCGFKKDRFYLYQSRWRPDLAMAHILPHWTWPDRAGEVTPVHVYTSGDEAELFLNGKSLGRKKKEQYQYRLRWDEVKYEPGELRVVAYKVGKKWAEETMKTTGAAGKVSLEPDRKTIKADGQDLAFVTVTVADKDGALVPRSKNRLQFSVSGPGEIIAVDNGDATDLHSFQSKERKAFNGLCLVVVRTVEGKPGPIVLKATSDGLAAGETTISAEEGK
ncbi:MAG: beta-galactosidase [Chthoniobacter sp.]|jgi:beta-galactosidase|nr:beta-galactosidase [Chthoniobacter sp.]